MNTLAFGFSPPDMIIIAIVALLVFGPKKLPELAKQMGQALREFRKISDEVTGAMHSVQGEVESIYKPVVLPPTLSSHTSSDTVEQAALTHETPTHGPLDQEPDALLPKVLPAKNVDTEPAVIEHAVAEHAPPVAAALTGKEH